jgi:Coenzyme PQQ synthesis protein D (PqqD)
MASDMLTISRSARLSKSPDGGVLLDVDRGVIFSLNSVGTRIVELLQQGKEEMSVAEAIRREFQVSEDTARKDVADFLATLREQLLLIDYREGGRSMESVPS